jgi:tRNA modification GTPase
MKAEDTIAAISTPPGRGGIGIVRFSGPGALHISGQLFLCVSAGGVTSPNMAYVGQVVSPIEDEALDKAILTWYRAPHSYTGEDVIELSCHGSPVILSRVLQAALSLGARLAEPGEFTLRAFLNRRVDLAQAQAVRDLIDAQTHYQARLATMQLGGALSRRMVPLKDSLIEVIVHLESSLEFVEDDISPQAAEALVTRLNGIIAELLPLAESFSVGKYVREGFDLAIAGKPNVGKSSVFNRLVGADRSIVTNIPGTTRDALYEPASIRGIPLRLIDTAGVRETDDIVESIGISRTRTAIADADIVVLVLDNSSEFTAEDLKLLEEVRPESRIILINKTDLPSACNNGLELAKDDRLVRGSALTGHGFDLLEQTIFEQLGGGVATDRSDLMITDARQHQALRTAVNYLSEARSLMLAREFEEIVLLKLRAGLAALGEVTGETLNEDILNQIFSTFCIGK